MTEVYKGQARRLRSALNGEGVQVGHRKALDLIAQAHGDRDWNTMQARLKATPQATIPSPSVLTQEKTMTRVRDGSIPQYLHSTFTADAGSIMALFDALPTSIGPWTRSTDTVPDPGSGMTTIHYRTTTKHGPRRLTFVVEQDRRAEVVNIVPDAKPGEAPDVTLTEANGLELDLVRRLQPLLGSQVALTQRRPTKHLRDRVAPDTYLRFQGHSLNRSTGNSHFLDKQRWLQFVILAAREGMTDSDEDRALVRAALLEEGFAQRHADSMSEEFQIQIQAIRATF